MAAMRSVGVRLRLYVDQYTKDAQQAVAANQAVGKSGKKTAADMEFMAGKIALVGGGLVALAGIAIYASARFDKAMSEVGAVAGATSEQMGELRDAALEAGAATVFSASEAAKAEAELARAGVSVADILGGALTGALDLAAAGQLDLGAAATIAAGAMNTFGLEGEDVSHIADVLASAANKSAASVEDLGLGLQQVGLVAAQVGFGLEETVGLLAAFADRGLRGSDGATSLKTALLRLAAPQAEAAETMERYGISLYDANGQMVDAVTIAGQLRTGLIGLTAQERNAALATIFGADAIRAANVLYAEGEAGITEYIRAVNDHGAAARMAAAMTDNLAGDVEELTGSLETLFIKSGSGAQGPLRAVVTALGGMVNGFGALPTGIQQTTVAVAGLTGIVLLGSAGFIKYRAATDRVNQGLIAMGPAGAVAAGGLRLVQGAVGIASLVLLAFTIDEVIEANETMGTTYRLVTPEMQRAEAAEREVAAAAQEVTRENLILAGSFGLAASEVDGLINAYHTLNDVNLTSRDAMRDAEAAVDDLEEALDASNGSLDITTERGRAAEAALDDLAEKAAIAAQETYDQTQSVEAANAVWENYIGQLRDILREAGFSETAIADLISQIANMPTYRALQIAVGFTYSGEQAVMSVVNGRKVWAVENRWGGVMESAASGTVRSQARIATVPQVQWAEPETGGEAYVPKRGDYLRSMGILSTAAGWYGASVMPNGGWGTGGGGSSMVDVRVTLEGGDSELMGAVGNALRFDVQQAGSSSVQGHYGRRGRV